jgi:hypothetical protein
MTGEQLNEYLCKQQMKFRKYAANIFTLQRAALKIQHWFFNKRLHSKRIVYVPFSPASTKAVARKSVPKLTETKKKTSEPKNKDLLTSQSFTARATNQQESKLIILQASNNEDLKEALKKIVNGGDESKGNPKFAKTPRLSSSTWQDPNSKSQHDVVI